MPDTAQERRIRRMLAKRDEKLVRLRPFNDQVLNPAYMVVDIRTNSVVSGGSFSDLDALEAELKNDQLAKDRDKEPLLHINIDDSLHNADWIKKR